MTILLVTDYGVDSDGWHAALTAAGGNIELRQWPDIGDPGDIDIILTDMPLGRHGGYRQFPNLRWVSYLGHGAGDVIADPTLPTSVAVTRLRDPAIIRGVAEYVVHAVTDHHLRADDYRAQQSDSHWQRLEVASPPQLTVVVLGLGSIGTRVAGLLRDLEFRILGWSTSAKSIDGITCHHQPDGLVLLLGQADYIVSALPSTPRTQGLFDAATLRVVKRGACLVNVGRGSLVTETDLIAALDDGILSAAYLDVLPVEPLPPNSALWRHPKVHLTPHTGGSSGSGEEMARVAANYRRFLVGEELEDRVDAGKGY